LISLSVMPLCVFGGAPIEIEEHTILACETALEMKTEQDKINQEINSYGVELYTRIGLNTDTVAVGNMGSETQFAYTCLGDGVNLSSRLEGANKQYGTMIMVSENTYQKVSDKFVFRKLDKVKVVGKDQPVVVYELVGRLGEVKEEIMKEVAGFETALDFYFAGDFANAIEKFSKLPENKTNTVFIERCKYLINNANTIKWEGVWEMTSK
jgi:adenylate cyclase